MSLERSPLEVDDWKTIDEVTTRSALESFYEDAEAVFELMEKTGLLVCTEEYRFRFKKSILGLPVSETKE